MQNVLQKTQKTKAHTKENKCEGCNKVCSTNSCPGMSTKSRQTWRKIIKPTWLLL